MNELLPLLYLKGISTNDFVDALTPLIGESAKNLSPGVISRLKTAWEDEYQLFRKRDLSHKRYVYFWADGIHLQARMEDSSECVLVIIGATEQRTKELLAIEGGHRENKESWVSLLLNLKNRGLKLAPKLSVGDGAKSSRGIYVDTPTNNTAFAGFNLQQYKIIHVHCNNANRHQRLHENRNQPELINDDMDKWADFLKKQAVERNVTILDTSFMNKSEMVDALKVYINQFTAPS